MTGHSIGTAQVRWNATRGWGTPEFATDDLGVRAQTSFVHYGQAVFEGLRVYFHGEGEVAAFRLYDHHRRLCASAQRMALPEPPWEVFFTAVRLFVDAHRAALTQPGDTLYLRPVLLATTTTLGITAPIADAVLVVTGLVNFHHMGTDDDGLTIHVERELRRAWPGGAGTAKCAGNYGLARSGQARAQAMGCDDALWLSPSGTVTELSSMNLFAVREGQLVVPEADELVLSGITCDSIMTLAQHLGVSAVKKELPIEELLADVAKGRVSEIFATGTAGGVVPIVSLRDGNHVYSVTGPTALATELASLLAEIQSGRAADPYGWLTLLPESVSTAAAEFRTDYTVYGYAHSPHKHLRPSVLVRLAQQAAADGLTAVTGAGLDYGARSWVVRRNVVCNWQTTPCVTHITVVRTIVSIGSCWLESLTEFFADGHKLDGTVRAFWVQLDAETQRPLPLPDVLVRRCEDTGIPTELMWRSELKQSFKDTSFESPEKRVVGLRHADFDALGHVNNAIYFDFIDHLIGGGNEIVMEYELPIDINVTELTVSTAESESGLVFAMNSIGNGRPHVRGLVRRG
ncbi:hypothetical protein BO226_25610 (plasmid) [Rhodococcus sp. 2G]|uniref:aminotransferase class IV n=1 Tax=unclassified Rhodococcus (in: high G+C Gram-positive bacteria) TaxID=192944 RepID=UPI0007D94E66|nr:MULTISPECIES: aminotransferase class IV [unclassified Rhodococcus (in: high G+C Gram-positive bacteria)]APE12724.1 hypothetical protein BO226_25610 [Rhodococcus sp. 2G]